VTHADRHPLNAISVCSGIGGLDLAVERVFGARPVAYVEREAYAQAVLLERMEEEALGAAPIHFDVRGFDGTRYRGLVDLVFGGIPCQPHSVAGKQRRGADERDLIDEFLRVVGEVGPRLVFVENVRGFVAGDGLGRILGGLADLGFDAEWLCLRAEDVGAPHRRERVFVLAYSQHAGQLICREAYHHYRRDAQWDDPDGCDPNVAYSIGSTPERRGKPGELRGEEARTSSEGDQREWRGASAYASGQDLGNAHRPRQDERQPKPVTRAFPAPWPPGPSGDWSGVREDLYPALESALCGVADGLPSELELATRHRVDRLRCLGNAVVPAQAEAALRHLLGRLA
jgi:DNA (cytosine-5)-methyltransferase 1